jgi:prepilin-type N-terminal cleavage/methylation domain-containing protein
MTYRSHSVVTNRQARAQTGYTIVELMIVVAVISVLMVISIPIYQSYTARSQFSEGLNLAAGLKQRIAEVMTFQGTVPGPDPTVNEAMGLAPPGSISGLYVSAIEILNGPPIDISKPDAVFENGTILIEYKNASAFSGNKFHAIQPFFLTGSIKWDCAIDVNDSGVADNLHVPNHFRPPACRK